MIMKTNREIMPWQARLKNFAQSHKLIILLVTFVIYNYYNQYKNNNLTEKRRS